MIEEGKTYKAHGQGTAITPRTVDVVVIHVGEKDVWYRVPPSREIKQTTIDRFESTLRKETT